ncbi:MAG TPA: hypothetical protein VFO29_11905 [Candidatus Rubrimentiphilum sp.]|nr:hypothetical protein [Candidatus Rubrimentiphilum sp.]
MLKLIQAALFFSGLALGAFGLFHHEQPKATTGSIQAGVQYINSYDKTRAQRQLECAQATGADIQRLCSDPTLLDGSIP